MYAQKAIVQDIFFPAEEDQFWLLAYANSVIFSMLKTMFDSTFYCQVGDVAKIVVPDLNMMKKKSVTELSGENVVISKCNWDAFETSWDFQHHPLLKKRVQLQNLLNPAYHFLP